MAAKKSGGRGKKSKRARKEFRVGVVGLGMGRHHVAGFQNHPRSRVAAVCDVNEERLGEIGDRFGVAARYTSCDEMLGAQELDVVSIATPNKFHKPLAVEALRAGCHVFCEKPMALSAAEAREMLDEAAKAGRRIMINFSYRFTEQGVALKREVDAGALGEVYFARTVWHRRRGMPGFGGWFGRKDLSGGGPLIDLGVHRLDLALWLMGYPKPLWVIGATYSHLGSREAAKTKKDFDVEDLAAGFVRFENGASLEVEASWAANIAEKELMETRLLGTEGGLVHRNVGGTYDFEAELFVERNGAHYDMKLSAPLPGVETAYYNFIEQLLGNAEPNATGEEGFIVMELLDAIYESARRGEPVRVE